MQVAPPLSQIQLMELAPPNGQIGLACLAYFAMTKPLIFLSDWEQHVLNSSSLRPRLGQILETISPQCSSWGPEEKPLDLKNKVLQSIPSKNYSNFAGNFTSRM